MNLSNIRNQIGKHIRFNEDDFIAFSKHLKMVSLKKNQIWEKANTVSKTMGFVNKGVLRQYYIKNDNEYTDNFFIENEFIGNYISHLSNESSQTYTSAIEPCELLVIPFTKLEELYLTLPIVAEFSKNIGDQKLFELNRKNSSFLMDSPEERYYYLMDQKPELLNRVPQYLIAQYLGIKPESLSRIKKRHIS